MSVIVPPAPPLALLSTSKVPPTVVAPVKSTFPAASTSRFPVALTSPNVMPSWSSIATFAPVIDTAPPNWLLGLSSVTSWSPPSNVAAPVTVKTPAPVSVIVPPAPPLALVSTSSVPPTVVAPVKSTLPAASTSRFAVALTAPNVMPCVSSIVTFAPVIDTAPPNWLFGLSSVRSFGPTSKVAVPATSNTPVPVIVPPVPSLLLSVSTSRSPPTVVVPLKLTAPSVSISRLPAMVTSLNVVFVTPTFEPIDSISENWIVVSSSAVPLSGSKSTEPAPRPVKANEAESNVPPVNFSSSPGAVAGSPPVSVIVLSIIPVEESMVSESVPASVFTTMLPVKADSLIRTSVVSAPETSAGSKPVTLILLSGLVSVMIRSVPSVANVSVSSVSLPSVSSIFRSSPSLLTVVVVGVRALITTSLPVPPV